MMTVEFIPKQEQKPIFGQVFFLIVSASVLATAVASYFIINQLIDGAQLELRELERTLVEDTRPAEERLFTKLQEYRQQVETLKAVLGEQKTLLPFFSLLERTTHPDIVFQTLNANPKTGIFELDGTSRNFFVLEQQRIAWEGRGEFESALSNIKLGQEGKGVFHVRFVADPELLKPL